MSKSQEPTDTEKPVSHVLVQRFFTAQSSGGFGKPAHPNGACRLAGPVQDLRKLERIRVSFRSRCGPFQEVLSYENRRIAQRELIEARCRWERAVTLVRLLFDENGNIEAYWIARDPKGPTPGGFKKGGYLFGLEMHRVAGWASYIPYRIVSADGTTPRGGAVRLRAPLLEGATEVECPWVEPCFAFEEMAEVTRWAESRKFQDAYPTV